MGEKEEVILAAKRFKEIENTLLNREECFTAGFLQGIKKQKEGE